MDTHINRRVAIVGATMTAAVFGVLAPADAEQSPVSRETEDGVTLTDLNQAPSLIPGFSQVAVSDITVEPGKKFGPNPLKNAMVCHVLDGELQIGLNPGPTFTAKKNDVWTCTPGMAQSGINNGSSSAILRITQLLR